VRGRGLLIGLELEGGQSGAAVAERALRAGLLLIPAGDRGEVLELTPPAVLTEIQLDHAIDAVTEIVRRWSADR
jgi:4-aminobutyrate aminotransferase-like enzyme